MMRNTMGIEYQVQQTPERLRACRLFLLDMDGTLYLGDDVYDGAIDFIRGLEATGRDYIYLTNNSSRAAQDYVTRLRNLGFPCEPENVYTSGQATGAWLTQHHAGKKVYLVGTEAFHAELRAWGVEVVNQPHGGSDPAHPVDKQRTDIDVVVAGFDTELVYRELDLAVHFLRKGATFVAANPDLVCPMPEGQVLPDCGSICQLLTASSGVEPYYIGKPNRSMVDVIAQDRGIPNTEICCVGDRLYTDIAVAQNAGAVSALVLSGETVPAQVEALKEKGEPLPDYIFADVAELHRVLA